jgi:hypothetical protein
MLLIGMFDSPYVRRVVISMKRLGLLFEHGNWSVGADFERICQYSPLGPHRHATVLRLPVVERGFRDAVLAPQILRSGAGVRFFQNTDDLLFRESSPPSSSAPLGADSTSKPYYSGEQVISKKNGSGGQGRNRATDTRIFSPGPNSVTVIASTGWLGARCPEMPDDAGLRRTDARQPPARFVALHGRR